MNKLLSMIAVAVTLSCGLAHAADEKPKSAQGSKLGACSKEAAAKGLKGDERNKYLSTCAKADAAPTATSQGSKLGACSKEAAAKGLKGDERNKYLSTCAKA